MSLFGKLIAYHDRWLLNDSARVKPWMSFLLGAVGVLGVALSWLSNSTEAKWLAAISGFAVGIAAEKFSQAQVRRVRLKFEKSKSITLQ